MLSIPYRWFFYFYIEQAEVREETFFESTLPGALKAKSNGNDRRQWRKQGVAVGAAASKTQAKRCGCWVPQPGQWHCEAMTERFISEEKLCLRKIWAVWRRT